MVNFTKDTMTKVYMNYDLDLCIKVIPNLIEWSKWLPRSGVKDKVIIKIVSLDFFSPNRLLVEYIIFRSLGTNGKRKNQIIIKVTTVKHSGPETIDRIQTFSRVLLQTGCLWQKLNLPFAKITVIMHVFLYVLCW